MDAMIGTRSPTARRRIRWAPPLLWALLLCGCPYSTEEPLSDPATAWIDPALVGAWRMQDAETGERQSVVFLPFNDHELVAYAPVDAPGETSLCRVFVTVIGRERFLNVRELGTDGTAWYFARYAVDGDRLVLHLVDDGLFGTRIFPSSQDRREFIRTHLDDPLLYAAEGEAPSAMLLERAEAAD
jgi:hypothetical protein